MSYVHRCLILPAAITAQCQQLSEALSGAAGANMWLTGLSVDGFEPVTHFISSGMISEEFAAMIASPALMFAACQTAELPVTLAECEAILGAADVSEEDAFAALARLGLVMITPSI